MWTKKPKKAKVFFKDNPWILRLGGSPSIAADINYSADYIVAKAAKDALCVACKGAKFLCGKTRCPLVVRLKYYFKTMPLIDSLGVDGASPPGVFVGRIGYPYVYAGPLVPPIHEDTSVYDSPELWFGKSIDDIVAFRSMLIRGKHRVHVKKFEEAGKIMERTRELALSVGPVDVELALKKKPQRALVLDDEIQPFGPSALLRDVRVGTSRWDQQIEKAYGDIDLKAVEAVTALYRKNVLVSRIQRAFSVGSFGLKDNRRLVPTRWSITAVDSIISKDLIRKIKMFPEINEFRVYESRYLDNRFEVLMMPGAWSYEAMEAWYPGTVWNPTGRNIVVFSDWEGFAGRTTYASIGGCYYAARLAVGELLAKERRQAVVVVLREAHPGYIMPVGVWQVRENVRNAMKQRPRKYNTLEEALQRITSQFQIPLKAWIKRSNLLQEALFQKKITEYVKGH
ncbi:MAG: Nre family DNA repair protein [Candidatus Bathyarchaeota archaeon]|nr:Nre family DNA repair protein [Candidatus Bathyarchaeota archaeon]MDH5732588.1 Nre family DNA repair protein [Candidatus Bathyarchaeota archaeon]